MDFKKPNPIKLFLFTQMRKLFRSFFSSYAAGLDLRGNEKLLEIGSGTGALTIHLLNNLKNGGSVTSVDTSAALMNIARKKLHDRKNLTIIEGDLSSVKLPAGSFDAAVIHYMLHDVDESGRLKLLVRIHELLKKGGHLFIREPGRKKHGMSSAEIGALMKESGFREIAMTESVKRFIGPLSTGVFVK